MLVPTVDGLLPTPATLVWARRHLETPVVIEDGGRSWTWREIATGAAFVAGQLPDVLGQPVAFSAPNGGGFVAILMGIWMAGGAPAPVSHRLPEAERQSVLDSISPVLTLATSGLGVDADVIIEIGDLPSAPLDPDSVLVPRLSPDTSSLIVCTSGTTGVPKAVVSTLRGVWGFIDNVARKPVNTDELRDPVTTNPSRIDSRPMVHSGAIYGLLSTFWRARPIVVMDRFDAVRYGQLVRDWQVSTLNLVPTMIRMLLDGGDEVGTLSPPASVATTGTAPLPEQWRLDFEARFGIGVQRTYGSTEVNTVSVEPVEDVLSGHRRQGTSGRIVPLVEVQIRAEDGVALEVGSTGEIWVRRETSHTRDGQGWIDTGDLGSVDAEGYIYVNGRKRELIIRGGLKMVPAEIENALLQHPAVVEAVVAGAPDPRLGEVPIAWVRTSVVIEPDELEQFVRARLTAYKVPTAIHLVQDFPRTENGKVRKLELLQGLAHD